ncbi:MAG: phosphate ABC transporter substrate-binding protein [candidate division WOR-3 bacterium]|nr:MAG: phosphate ABC transporter substrate-binding protein [candidate division WOR-3 bacterium]
MRLFLVISFIFLMSCAPNKCGVIIAGSTSVQPFIEKVAEHFMEENPGIVVNVQGGGSTAGVQATINGTCEIGASSRNLKPSERDLEIVLIALDGIAVIVHKDNPVEDLSVEQIRNIFSGKTTNWRELGGLNSAIIPVTREEGSGTRASFENMIMGDDVISDACLVQDSNGAVREIIATTPQGVGYISVGLIDEREKAVAIDGAQPTLANLITEKYRFARPFLLLLRDEPKGDVKKFIDYTLSSEGQRILGSSGLIPANQVASD